MHKFVFSLCLLSLPLLGQTGSNSSDPIRDITLNVSLLQNNPALLATDTIGIIVEAREEAYYKLSAQDEIITAGRLVSGSNALLITRTGMFAKTQSLPFNLELKTGDLMHQKAIVITITIAGGAEQSAESKRSPASEFTITLFQSGRQIGFRKKTMTDLLQLTTGLVTPVDDPAATSPTIRSTPPGQSISILGLAMGIAKHLADKKLAAAKKIALAKSQKRKMAVHFNQGKKNGRENTVHAEIELEAK
jgi:hypothetical protein